MDIINNFNYAQKIRQDACNGIIICLEYVTLADIKPFTVLSETLARMTRDTKLENKTQAAAKQLAIFIKHRLKKKPTWLPTE